MITALRQGFQENFGSLPEVLSRAPGRLEILGNHTDYNEGTVLSVAVDRAMHIAASPAPGSSGLCRVVDLVSDSRRTIDLHSLEQPRKGDWGNYIKGLIVELHRREIRVPAFDAVLYGTVPLSAGMSSSAALEMAMLLVLLKLAGVELPWLECAKIGQACENHYVGANTGLLDQVSSLKGKKGHLIYSDFRHYTVDNVPIPQGTAFVVANSMVKHNLTNEYNERREACEEAVHILAGAYPGVKALRDVTVQQLHAAEKLLPPLVFRRALHVVGEIDRVETGREALRKGDIAGFGKRMQQSHQSSMENFENSCPEIDRLVEIGQTLPGYLGARISGGGFGGISVHLVQSQDAQNYQKSLEKAYQERCGIQTATMLCQADDGARLLNCNASVKLDGSGIF
ncbi:MAG: galactokinase [Lentisphaeria bacterium]|nr:galactokinase [Lentisphaeria bacterium]